jgi:hypothetical protein
MANMDCVSVFPEGKLIPQIILVSEKIYLRFDPASGGVPKNIAYV